MIRVDCPAVLTPDGEIYTGYTHSVAVRQAIDAGCIDVSQFVTGFLTTDRQFVSCAEAGRIAIESGQIPRLASPDFGLTSQELGGAR